MIRLKNKYIKLFLLFSFLFSNQLFFCAELLKGDEQVQENQSFSFPVQMYAMNGQGDSFYVGAHPDAAGASKEFAVSKVSREERVFIPLTPQKTKVNGNLDQDNPLFNRGIRLLRLMEKEADRRSVKHPVVVPSKINPGDADRVYTIDDFSSVRSVEVVSSPQLRDAAGNPTSDVEGIATAGSKDLVFAAVKNSNGDDFGEPGIGIAVLQFLYQNVRVCDPKTGEEVEAQGAGKVRLTLNQLGQAAASLHRGSELVKIGNSLAIESMEFSDMHWDPDLRVLYIALKVASAGDQETDGAKAIVIGKIEEIVVGEKKIRGFTLQSIVANDNVFTNQNEIVGGLARLIGQEDAEPAQISIHKIRSMFSSNRLSYLITLGANVGDTDNTKKSVFALPLVNNPSDKENHGKLANKDALPEDLFGDECNIIRTLRNRLLKQAAEGAGTVLTTEDDAAKVGAGILQDGDIIDIFVEGDAVYAVVGDPADHHQTGVFMSHALFDQNGKIKRWTTWQRVANSNTPNENIYGATLDPKFGNFVTMTGDTANNVKTVKRTEWGSGNQNGLRGLVGVLNSEFLTECGGIHGLFEFPNNTPVLENIAMLVATGLQKVALIEMGQVINGVLIRNTGDFALSKKNFENGRITENFPPAQAKSIFISGGALDELGPIDAAAVTSETNANQARLFVGGVGGLAMLVQNGTGNGWSNSLGPDFANLANNMSFKKVSDFCFVRKLVVEENLLYVLTDLGLFRIDLSDPSNNFVTGNLKTTQLTSNFPANATFLDFVVSGNVGILATSAGLYRVVGGQDISTAQSVDWVPIEIPKYCGPIKQLFPFSQTLLDWDFAKENVDGMLYVLGAYYGKNTAQFNRFTINADQEDNATIAPFPDYFVQDNCAGQGSTSYFVNYGTYRKMLNEDGGLRFSAADRDFCFSPFVELLPPGLITGIIAIRLASRPVALSLDIENNSDVVKILRSITGPVLIAGNFGLRVNE